MADPKLALCLPGGGAPGVMFQIAALAALEDCLEGFRASDFALYVGSSSGACLAAALAGGQDVRRIYRALLDPADDYFPLERRHVLRMDLEEWRRTAQTAVSALGQGSRSWLSRSRAPSPSALWEELARLYDSMPAGVFSLEGYERFLEDIFARRGVPNQFSQLPRQLRIIAHDLDTGEPALFGQPGLDHVPLTRACIASMATPPLFSPVRIGQSHFINPAPSQVAHPDLAAELGADVIVVVNPMVPLKVNYVPTGHGVRASVRDKGAMWVANQANRIKLHALLHRSIADLARVSRARVIVIEPEATDGTLFMHNPASFAARRAVLESSYRFTRELLGRWLQVGGPLSGSALSEVGWSPRPVE